MFFVQDFFSIDEATKHVRKKVNPNENPQMKSELKDLINLPSPARPKLKPRSIRLTNDLNSPNKLSTLNDLLIDHNMDINKLATPSKQRVTSLKDHLTNH